ncbi:MAG: dihydroneopterin aldolase [Deltaproteobacteria bacterium]|nr:dihydroneopterin aldolase [Deltaproteobacteria bacterium]
MPFSKEEVRINDLRVDCIIGIDQEEREQIQPLFITITFPVDFGPSAQSAQIEDTVDYSDVAAEARRFVVEGQFRLLEELARALARHLCERFPLSAVSLNVLKPESISGSGGASVSLSYSRD